MKEERERERGRRGAAFTCAPTWSLCKHVFDDDGGGGGGGGSSAAVILNRRWRLADGGLGRVRYRDGELERPDGARSTETEQCSTAPYAATATATVSSV